jgi:hypothetical protein
MSNSYELFAGASEWQLGPVQIRRPSSTGARSRASPDLPRPQPLHGMGQQLLRSPEMVGRYAFKKRLWYHEDRATGNPF